MSRKAKRKGSPRQAQQQTGPTLPIVEPVDPYAEFRDREWDLWLLPEAEAEVVDERALHALVKDWRHGRATRSIAQALQDAYFAIFSIVLLGAMVANLVLQSQATMARCETAACQLGRTLVPWALLGTSISVVLALARLFGPVMASAPEGFWIMDAPISRSRLLRGRLWAAVSMAFTVPAVLAALVAALAGLPGMLVLGWSLAAGLASAALMAWAAADQPRERAWPTRVGQALGSLIAAAAMTLMVTVSAEWITFTAPDWLGQAPWAIAGLGLAGLVPGVLVARARLDRIRRARLLSGGSLVSGMQGAMFALDLGLARDILVERDAIARGHVRPTSGRGLGTAALVWRDLQRMVRFPRPLVGLVAAMLVPYAVDALGLSAMTALLSSLALVAALVPFLSSMRVLSRTNGLARCFPFANAEIRTALMVIPAILALVWAAAILPSVIGLTGGLHRSLRDAVATTLVMAAAGLLGAVRWQVAKPVDFGTPMVATASGAVPPALLFNLFRGFDVVAVVTAPILLGASPLWSAAIAFVVFFVLRSGTSVAEMQEQAEEQRKELARVQNQPSQKVTLPRPKR